MRAAPRMLVVWKRRAWQSTNGELVRGREAALSAWAEAYSHCRKRICGCRWRRTTRSCWPRPLICSDTLATASRPCNAPTSFTSSAAARRERSAAPSGCASTSSPRGISDRGAAGSPGPTGSSRTSRFSTWRTPSGAPASVLTSRGSTSPVFKNETEPQHARLVAQEPGLHFVGLNFLYAASSGQINGVGRDAEHVVNAVASRVRGGRAPRERVSI